MITISIIFHFALKRVDIDTCYIPNMSLGHTGTIYPNSGLNGHVFNWWLLWQVLFCSWNFMHIHALNWPIGDNLIWEGIDRQVRISLELGVKLYTNTLLTEQSQFFSRQIYFRLLPGHSLCNEIFLCKSIGFVHVFLISLKFLYRIWLNSLSLLPVPRVDPIADRNCSWMPYAMSVLKCLFSHITVMTLQLTTIVLCNWFYYFATVILSSLGWN